MTADVSFPDPPEGAEWLELATMLAMVLMLAMSAYLAGYQQAVGALSPSLVPEGPPGWVTTTFWLAAGSVVLFASGEIVAKRIAGSDGDASESDPEQPEPEPDTT
jgi:hypothetical protein